MATMPAPIFILAPFAVPTYLEIPPAAPATDQYRFNRRFDLKSILVRLVRAAVRTRPRPEPMIWLAEVEG